MKPAEHPTALRTQQLLAEAGIVAQVVEFEQPTRTSADAADAARLFMPPWRNHFAG